MIKKVLCILVATATVLFSVGCKSCNNKMFDFGEYNYPDYPLASKDDTKNSWEQKDDSIIEIDWFIDNTSYYLPKDNTVVTNEILKQTGVKINFKKATTSDGSELTTMIAGNDLPDILSVTSGMYDLINDKKIFPINGLAERWAPSLNRRLKEDPEMKDTYTNPADDNLYFLMNNFYSSKQLDEYAEVDGHILPNDGIVVRKDYLKAYIEHMKGEKSAWTDADMTNPDGIFDFLSWVKKEYKLTNENHSVLLSAFDSAEEYASRGLRVLAEYFGCKEENSDGTYAYPMADKNYTEMIKWLNKLYKAGLLTEGCLGATQAQVNSYIQNGEPIMYMGKMITPAGNFRNWEQNNPLKRDAAYVPIIFLNTDGAVPQLSFHSSGELATMVTSSCKRPDRVIKLLDYLYSEDGQRLIYYGIDKAQDDVKGTFKYKTQPGTTVDLGNGKTHTYRYGQIEYTDEIIQALRTNVENYGIYFCMFLCNPMYMYLTSTTGGQFNNYRDYVKWNSRAALIPYTYNYRGFDFSLDSSDSRYKFGLTASGNMRSKWFKKIAGIIASPDAATVEKEIKSLLDWCEKSEKLSEYIAYKNDCFKAHKKRLGIIYAYAPNDPLSTYKNLKIDTIYGVTKYNKEIPADMLTGN